MTGELIVSRETFLQFARCFYDKMSQFSVKLRDPLLDDNAWLPQLVSKKFLEEKFFARNFHKLVFDRENLASQKFPINLSAYMGMRLQYFIIPYIVHIRCGTYLTTKHFPFRSIHYFIILFSKF